MSHTCLYRGCKRSYVRKEHLRRHQQDHINEQPYWCHVCPSKFNRRHTLKRHLEEVHQCRPITPVETPTGHQDQVRIASDKALHLSLFIYVPQDVDRVRAVENYFKRFHPKWPILHKATFQSFPQPPELVQAVMMVGQWTEQAASSESRTRAESHHDALMRWVDIRLLPILTSSTNGLLSPASLPLFQTIFITVAFAAHRSKASSPFAMTSLWYLIQTLKNIGVYEQVRIGSAVPNGATLQQQFLVQEQYQRLGLLSFKLHMFLWSLFLTIHPKFKLSDALTPAMLNVQVPSPLRVWDSPISEWPEKRAHSLMQNQTALQGEALVSSMFHRAVNLEDFRALSSLIHWDFELGMCLNLFASRQFLQPKAELMKHVRLILDVRLLD